MPDDDKDPRMDEILDKYKNNPNVRDVFNKANIELDDEGNMVMGGHKFLHQKKYKGSPAKLADKIESILNEHAVNNATVMMNDYMEFLSLMKTDRKVYISLTLVLTKDGKYYIMVTYDGEVPDQ